MNIYRLKPIAALLVFSLSGLAHAQPRPVEDKWFPELTSRPNVVKPERVDMPDVEPMWAQQCTGGLKPFEVAGNPQKQQRGRTLESRSESDGVVAMAAPTPAPAPGSSFAPPAVAMSKSMPPMPAPASVAPMAERNVQPRQDAPLRAGFVDDNVDFVGFISFLGKKRGTLDNFRARDISERHGLDIKDASGRPLQGAVVYMNIPTYNGSIKPRANDPWKAVAISDVNGKAWVFPKAVSSSEGPYRITVGYDNASRDIVIDPSRKARTQVSLDTRPRQEAPRLDLSIVIDTTGSMSDEIRKLQSTLTKVVAEVERQGVDVCVNVTAYRDVEDAYILKGLDFTSNLGAVQNFVNDLSANGGGDEPEALNQALDHVVNKLAWRKQSNVVRSVMLITDAPPKMDTAPIFYDRSMLAAGARGIRIHSVGTSGLNTNGGELVLRQVAQYTGGKFVFLTYKDAQVPSRGAGDATVHDVQNYSVDTLDDLLLRLVKDDLGVQTSARR